jgi:hypothetical protein
LNLLWAKHYFEFDFVLRAENQPRTVVRAGDIEIGGGEFIVMAGTCPGESSRQTLEPSEAVVKSDARILRDRALKPRSSPYSFQDLGKECLRILIKARELTGQAIFDPYSKNATPMFLSKVHDGNKIHRRATMGKMPVATHKLSSQNRRHLLHKAAYTRRQLTNNFVTEGCGM